ncbi:MAG TPA: hypothetical protein VHB79_07560 [Polyangiaceae bacterium]|nr:hypothetical protein [Polyangiaceae bacterium]
MKTTSAHYFLPLLLSVGLPVACSGTTDKIMDRSSSSDAGAGHDDGSSGGESQQGSGEAGEGAVAGKGGEGHVNGGSGGATDGGSASGGTARGGSGGATTVEGGAGPDGGGAGGAGGDGVADTAGAAGVGGDGGVIETPVDPTLDGADDAASGRYRLHYKPQSKCLASAKDDGISAVACNNNQDQKFFIDGAGGQFVRVRGVDSNECIGLGADAEPGSVVCSEDAKVQLIPTGNGYFQLVLPNDTCLGVLGDLPRTVKCTADTVWSFDDIGTNFALKAKWTATSTFPGYSTDYVHDGDHNAGLSGHSWANNWNPPSLVLPQEVNVDLGAPKQISTVNVFTSSGYEIGSYDLDYFDGQKWVNLASVKENVLPVLTHSFPTVVTQKLRFTVRRGPEAQFNYTRLNEVEIY